MTIKTSTVRSAGTWQGMNWIRQEKRLAIYLRDGCACAYCGASIENGAQLTLDHVVAHSKGGTNEHTNLITCCKRCNDSKGARSTPKFATAIAAYLNHGITAAEILKHVRNCQQRDLAPHMVAAKELIARRGSAAAALANRN